MSMINFMLIMQIFILLNPLASVPLLISAYKRRLNVRIIAFKSVIGAFIIAFIIAISGHLLFDIFGITLNGLKIAGGVVLILLGINMIRPKNGGHEVGDIDGLAALIATPMLTGPGTISFITVKVYEIGRLDIIFNLILAFLLLGIVFITLAMFINKINLKIIDVLSRVFGLFLTAVAVEMIAKGISGFVQAYAIL